MVKCFLTISLTYGQKVFDHKMVIDFINDLLMILIHLIHFDTLILLMILILSLLHYI